jgi:hypothetical protein
VEYVAQRRAFKVDHEYRDSSDTATNEFHRWIGVKLSGGIRPLKRRDGDGLAVLVLLSSEVSVATYNPWEDVLDPLQGRLWYWGDAKAHPTKTRDDFQGNRYLQQIWIDVNEGNFDRVPPILHFSKPKKGLVRFNGVCVLKELQDAWMEEKGKRVRNYLARLDVLPIELCDVAWLRARVRGDDTLAPPEWLHYTRTGDNRRLITYARKIRSPLEQLPPERSAGRKLLHTLATINASKFERLVVRAFESLDVSHSITQTRNVRDGGFDFYGSFRLPPPLSYEIGLKGEIKRYQPGKTTVGVKDIARLVARLQRGEHGLFATTSIFTRQAQEEVYADRYPVDLLDGGRLTGILAHCGAVRNGILDPSWLQ